MAVRSSWQERCRSACRRDGGARRCAALRCAAPPPAHTRCFRCRCRCCRRCCVPPTTTHHHPQTPTQQPRHPRPHRRRAAGDRAAADRARRARVPPRPRLGRGALLPGAAARAARLARGRGRQHRARAGRAAGRGAVPKLLVCVGGGAAPRDRAGERAGGALTLRLSCLVSASRGEVLSDLCLQGGLPSVPTP